MPKMPRSPDEMVAVCKEPPGRTGKRRCTGGRPQGQPFSNSATKSLMTAWIFCKSPVVGGSEKPGSNSPIPGLKALVPRAACCATICACCASTRADSASNCACKSPGPGAANGLWIGRRGRLLCVFRLGHGAIIRLGNGLLLRFNRAVAADAAVFFAGNFAGAPNQ